MRKVRFQKARFLDRLKVENAHTLDDGEWALIAVLRFLSVVADRIFTVPVGFVTNYASVPRLPLAYWICGGIANEAAALHDYLYTSHAVSRRMADAVLLEAMKVTGVNFPRRWLMWLGVRLFGWSHW